MAKPSRRMLLARVKYWRVKLGLTDWDVSVEVTGGLEAGADAEAQPAYKQAILRFDLDAISREELDSFVVHELLHLPVWALAEAAEHLAHRDKDKLKFLTDLEESLVTHLERVIVGLVREPG